MGTTETITTRSWQMDETAKLVHLILHGFSNEQIATHFKFMFPNRTTSSIGGKVSDVRRIARPETTGTCRVQFSKIAAKKIKAAVIQILRSTMPVDIAIADFADFTPKYPAATVEDVLNTLVVPKKPAVIPVFSNISNNNNEAATSVFDAPHGCFTYDFNKKDVEKVPTTPISKSRESAWKMFSLILDNTTETLRIDINSKSIQLSLTVNPD